MMRAILAAALLVSASALNAVQVAKSKQDQVQDQVGKDQQVDHAINSMSSTVSDLQRDVSAAAATVAKEAIAGAIADVRSINEMVGEGQKLQAMQKYTFKRFVEDFKRTYQPRSEEWIRREETFNKNLRQITDHLAGPAKSWSQGINKFMDYTDVEMKRLMGYKGGKSKGASALLQTSEKPKADEPAFDFKTLPKDHTWRLPDFHENGGLHRDQGACGSCWAIAATEALETHLRIKHGSSEKLSPQMLVSCMPNLKECGGKGGCAGATAELAYEYIQTNGIPLDMNWPYTSMTGVDGKCNWMLQKLQHARVDGFVTLPENQYDPLMKALYLEGPVVISVDASTWQSYNNGVYAGCPKDAIINHAVVAEGFGEDFMDTTKKNHKYFLIKNSWGPDWGELGYIRLERIENPNDWHGIDNKPEEGTACKGGPKFVKVAGMCGMYYDSVYPTGARFVTPFEGGTKWQMDTPMNMWNQMFNYSASSFKQASNMWGMWPQAGAWPTPAPHH